MQDTPTRLDELAGLLADVSVAGSDHPPTFVAVRGLGTPDADLLFVTLGDGPVPLALLDIDGDPSWDAVGLVATGTAHSVAGGPSVPPQPVHVVTLLDRDGALAGSVRGEGLDVVDTPPGEGLAVDALHRVLDLPTPPPPADTSEVWSVVWARALLGGPPRRSLGWRSAAALHPAAHFCPGGRRQAHTDLPAHVGRLVARADWQWLHRFAVRKAPLAPMGLTPARAARLDLGAFARWLLATLPPLDRLLEQCDVVLAPSVARRVREVAGDAVPRRRHTPAVPSP